jgi:hypothetical protein
MPFVVADRVRETTTTTGTGTITLSGTAPTGFQTFGTAIGNGNNTFYTIAGGSEWEVGIGTYTAAGTTLSRDTVLSSSAGGTTKVTFSAGTKDVFVDYPAGKAVYQDGSITAALGTVTAPSYSFTGDTNTGMFSPAADFVALSTAGVERLRIRSNGRVGVNVDPGSQFQVRSPASDTMAEIAVLQAINVAGTDSHGLAVSADPTANIVQLASTGNNVGGFTFLTGGTERMRLDSGGNFLVNATSGAGQLTVNSGSGAASILLTNTSTSNPYLQFANGSFMQGISDGSLRLRTTTAFPLIFDTNSAEAMRITSAGNVGIGTNSPVARLHLFDTLAPEARLQIGTTTSQGAYTFYSSTINEAGIGFTPNSAIMSIYSGRSAAWGGQITFTTDTSERMRITQTGNVGVGTAGPQARFTVGAGNMALSTLGVGLTGSTPATGTQKLILGGNSADGVGNEIGWYPNTSFTGDIAQITAISTAYGVSSAGAMIFRTNGGAGATPAERMRLDSNGSLGIGTTAAAARLHTNGGAGGINAVFESNTTADTRIEFRNNATRAGYLYWDANEVRTLADPSRSITSYTNGVERMRINSSGNVGIGITAPAARLHVLNSSIADQLRLQDVTTDATTKYGVIGAAHYTNAQSPITIAMSASSSGANAITVGGGVSTMTSATIIQFFTAATATTLVGTERMRIDSSGQVGIGTTPSARLDVNGNIRTTVGSGGTLILHETDATRANQLVSGADASGSYINASFATGGSAILRFQTANTERMRITAAGDVGIGTTSPNYKLEVRTDAASGFNWVGSFNNTATGGFGAGFLARSSVGSAYFYMRGDGLAYVENSTNNGLGFATNATEKMRITAAGDVGVGITTPSTRIHAYNNTANTPVIVRTQQASTGNNFDYASFSVSATGASGGLVAWATGSLRAGQVWVQSDGAQPLVLGTNDTERMRVTSTGTVGINTSTPGAQLETYVSAGSVVALRLNTNYVGGNTVDINPYIAGVSNAGYSVTVGGTIRQVIDSSGNAGFGVTSPATRMDARVTNPTRGIIYLGRNDGATGQTGSQIQLSQNGIADWAFGQPAATNAFAFWVGRNVAADGTEVMRLTSAGNLLLGTTTADQLLTVAGNIATTNGANRYIKLCSSTNYNYTVSAVGDDFQILEAGTTARLTIKYPNGDVGIGTTSPASRLHAAGITRISDATNSTAVAIDPVTTAGLTSIIAQFGGSQLAFGAAGVENFRITSTGGITSSNLADAVGYKGLPQNSQTAAYTLALSDMGKHISITTGGVVIPANGSVAFPIGSAVTIFNNSGSNQTISITTDTLHQAGTANTGSRTLAQYGVATVLKVTSTVWVISGAGVS